MKYLDIDLVIDEDLYNLIIKYNKQGSSRDLKEEAHIAIENSKVDIPELFNETREYPPFFYYMILSMLNRKKIYEKWSKASKERKEELIKECYTWLETLASEVREPNEEELKLLSDSNKNIIKIE
jgi:hypothetical protein